MCTRVAVTERQTSDKRRCSVEIVAHRIFSTKWIEYKICMAKCRLHSDFAIECSTTNVSVSTQHNVLSSTCCQLVFSRLHEYGMLSVIATTHLLRKSVSFFHLEGSAPRHHVRCGCCDAPNRVDLTTIIFHFLLGAKILSFSTQPIFVHK